MQDLKFVNFFSKLLNIDIEKIQDKNLQKTPTISSNWSICDYYETFRISFNIESQTQ